MCIGTSSPSTWALRPPKSKSTESAWSITFATDLLATQMFAKSLTIWSCPRSCMTSAISFTRFNSESLLLSFETVLLLLCGSLAACESGLIRNRRVVVCLLQRSLRGRDLVHEGCVVALVFFAALRLCVSCFLCIVFRPTRAGLVAVVDHRLHRLHRLHR